MSDECLLNGGGDCDDDTASGGWNIGKCTVNGLIYERMVQNVSWNRCLNGWLTGWMDGMEWKNTSRILHEWPIYENAQWLQSTLLQNGLNSHCFSSPFWPFLVFILHYEYHLSLSYANTCPNRNGGNTIFSHHLQSLLFSISLFAFVFIPFVFHSFYFYWIYMLPFYLYFSNIIKS